MKRSLIVFAALALTGALAFADDMAAPVAKIGGYVNAGILVASTSDGVTYKSRANDFGADGYVGKITASIAAPTYGINLTTQLKQVGGMAVDTSYAWVSPLAGLKLEAGSGNSNPLGDVDNIAAGLFSQAGLTADYNMGPITVGADISAPTVAGAASQVTFGGRYALDKVATVNVTGQTAASTGKFDKLIATASLQAVDNLNASVGYNASSMSATTSNTIDVEAGYKITPEFKADVIVWSYSGGATKPATTLQYKPNVSYSLGNGLTASAYVQGDNNSVQSNIEAQGELDVAIGAATIKNQVMFDTAPNHVASDKSKTTLESDFIFSF